MTFSVQAGSELGKMLSFGTSEGNHPPEVWAEMTANKILSVADSTPQPIRDQAMAFRKQLVARLTIQFREALRIERETIAAKLDRNGMGLAGHLVRKG